MMAEDLINSVIPGIYPWDHPEKARDIMDDLNVTQLPVVRNEEFLGFILEESLPEQDLGKMNQTIGDFTLSGKENFVHNQHHFFDLVKVATEHKFSMVAVINSEEQYMGVITYEDLVVGFSRTSAVQSPGGIIEITMNHIDYSMAEITRLIESNDVKILGTYIINDPNETGKINLTIKMDKRDVSHVVATLRRFDFEVKGHYQEEKILSNEEERLGMLMKFINI